MLYSEINEASALQKTFNDPNHVGMFVRHRRSNRNPGRFQDTDRVVEIHGAGRYLESHPYVQGPTRDDAEEERWFKNKELGMSRFDRADSEMLMELTYLTPQEVADTLKVARGTVYGWISSGKIEARRFGGTVRIPRRALENTELPKEPPNSKPGAFFTCAGCGVKIPVGGEGNVLYQGGLCARCRDAAIPKGSTVSGQPE